MTTTDASPISQPLAIPTVLEKLRAAPPHAVLSVYLATGGQWPTGAPPALLSLRKEVKQMRQVLSGEELAAFERAVARAETRLTRLLPGYAGIAVFVGGTGAQSLEEVVALPSRPVEQVVWDNHPHVAQLEHLLDDEERFAFALFDVRRARLFTIFLGAIEERREIVDDDVPSKQATGGWYGLAETHIQRHREQHVAWHAVRTSQALVELLRARPFDRLVLAGPPEAVSTLKSRLTRPLLARLVDTIHLSVVAEEPAILAATRLANERIERAVEDAKVNALLEATRSSHVALGMAAVLNALAEGRVHELIIAEGFAAFGGRCTACERLVAAPLSCPGCGRQPDPVPDLHEELVEEARRQGATVEYVRGAAAARLQSEAGVGAWTRF